MNTNTTLEYKAVGVATSQGAGAGAGAGYIVKGFMTLFNVPDLVGDVTKPGAFSETIFRNPHPPLLWGHNTSLPPIGRVKNWHETADGVFFIAELAPTTMGEDLKALVSMGAVSGVSYGYNIKQAGKERKNGNIYRTLEKVDVMEVSLVNFPAHPDARLVGSEGKDLFTVGEVECLRSCGFKVKPSKLLEYVNALERMAERRMKPARLVEHIERELSELREV